MSGVDRSEMDRLPPSLTAEDLITDQALAQGDQDRFERAAVAARIADLASVAELPVSIGLFGPWGSGKSSMESLIREALEQRAELPEGLRVKLVRYDAWKYGGHSLRRNFIAVAAKELGLTSDSSDGERFHRGLYEKRRRAEIDTGQVRTLLWRVVPRFFATYVLFVLVFAGVSGSASIFTSRDFFGEIQRALPQVLAGGALLTFLMAALKTAFDVGRVDIEQAQASEEEEFTDAFRDLVSEVIVPAPREGSDRPGLVESTLAIGAKISGKISPSRQVPSPPERFDRLVFFIDELDRCTEEDVVETLTAVRTFLGDDDCVFIVAADRAVLERALERKLRQATPVDENAPYYSSAGAFLDKIFQHQLSLPPLRTRRLTAYARDLTRTKTKGLWAELREAGLSSQVLPVLVPNHVRSPRRVKVLLNNFATNARIAQARGVEWPGRAPELAKLTVLQTEFPDFASSMLTEPRLPALLLVDGPSSSERTQDLLEKFRDGAIETYLSTDEDDRDRKVDAGENPQHDQDDDEGKSARMRAEHRRQLHRFLYVNRDVADPRSDLLYLEAPGALFGMVDPDLGELVEHDAPDFPKKVNRALEQRDPETQAQAVRLLADLVPGTVGKERQNVMTVLCAATDRLYELPDVDVRAWNEAAAAALLFIAEETVEPARLVSFLRIALESDNTNLRSWTLGDDDLYSADDRLEDLGRMLHRLTNDEGERIAEAIGDRLTETPSVLAGPLQALPVSTAEKLLTHTHVSAALTKALNSEVEDARLLAEALLDAVLIPDDAG